MFTADYHFDIWPCVHIGVTFLKPTACCMTVVSDTVATLKSRWTWTKRRCTSYNLLTYDTSSSFYSPQSQHRWLTTRWRLTISFLSLTRLCLWLFLSLSICEVTSIFGASLIPATFFLDIVLSCITPSTTNASVESFCTSRSLHKLVSIFFCYWVSCRPIFPYLSAWYVYKWLIFFPHGSSYFLDLVVIILNLILRWK